MIRVQPFAITLAAVAMLGGPSARAAKSAGQDQIHSLNQEAVSAFESYSFKKARSSLQRALDLAAAKRLRKDPVLAETYVLLAVAYVAGSNDLYRGLHYFVRALRLHPKVAVPKNLATPQLLAIFKTAQKTARSVRRPPAIALSQEKAATAAAGAAAGSGGRGLQHTPIDAAKKGYPIPVKARAGLDIQAHRVYLHFRQAGTVKFTRLPMKKSRGVFRAAIPGKAARGRYVHYYIEAVDQRGRLAASMGSARSPNVVILN